MLLASVVLHLLVFQGSVDAWSQHRSKPTNPVPKENSFDEAFDRRDALKKLGKTAFLGLGVTVNGADAIAATGATTAKSNNTSNKNIYQPTPNSMNGKIVVITGGTSGLGLESAKRLATAGATIVLTARTDSKGLNAISAVKEYLANRSVENENIYTITLDLNDLDSIKSFPQQYSSKLGSESKIDVLLNNAGVAAIPQRELTKDGFERTFQSNHLGPFALTALLFPHLNRGEGGSRIINVSSIAHNYAFIAENKKNGLDLDNLNGEIDYSASGWSAYCRSKLENILFTQELQRRADEAGLGWLTVTALHPGAVATDIWRYSYIGVDKRGAYSQTATGGGGGKLLQSFISRLFYGSILTVEEGANTQVMLASYGEKDGEPVKGQYYDERMRLKTLDDFARDVEKAQYLWDRSQEMSGVQFVVK